MPVRTLSSFLCAAILCLATVLPWRSSTSLGTSEAYSASWRWPGLKSGEFDEDEDDDEITAEVDGEDDAASEGEEDDDVASEGGEEGEVV